MNRVPSVSGGRKPQSLWLRQLGVVLVFVVAGPPIGGLVFVVFWSILELSLSKLGLMIFAAFIFVPFTYPIGVWPAAAAGALMALAYGQFARVGLATALVIGILVGLGFMMVNGSDSVPAPGGPWQRTMPAHWLAILLANVIPTLALWFVTRDWFGQTTQSKEIA